MSFSHMSRPSSRRPPGRRLAAAVCLAMSAALAGAGAHAQETPGVTQDPPAQPSPPVQQQAPPSGQGQAAEPPVEVARFQDWAVRCGQPQGQPQEICEMFQEQNNSDGRPIMGVAVARVSSSPSPGMLIILPLGIALPEGVAVKIDDGEEVPVEVQRCQRRGCEIEILLEPDLLNRFKSGRQANVLFHVEERTGVQKVSVPISLLGFTAALDEVLS
jgi:invasion protein IalB